ncbi:hypothetical protein JCM19239_7719 [Vibrio variabilis]|uniref:Uncharacterized protein n=1 Tax=Vibrio variabilis TaxID=990271 RepID=A0ABQ0J6E0_9VIBR|nr:hypothetical protein JCM19239_7719 [Vibrio variabilis]
MPVMTLSRSCCGAVKALAWSSDKVSYSGLCDVVESVL